MLKIGFIFFTFREPNFGYLLVELDWSNIAKVAYSFTIRHEVYFYDF